MVTGTESELRVGGICGVNTGKIENCYNTETITGKGTGVSTAYVGGICGLAGGTVTNCYNSSKINVENASYGAICGYIDMVSITNCYFLKGEGGDDGFPTKGAGESDGIDETIGKTAEEFASGEVAWLLNGKTSEGDLAWRQKVSLTADEDASRKQPFPVLDGDIVYYNETDKYHNHFAYCNICGGAPTQNGDGYYEISNAQELYWFAKHVNTDKEEAAKAILTADIVLYENLLDDDGNPNSSATQNWSPIGYVNNPYDKSTFTGTFDGDNHTISGLYFDESSAENVGLFGYTNEVTIKNVGVKDSYFKGRRYVGGVCGYNDGGTIDNSYNVSTVIGTGSCISGVCGYNQNGGTITNSHNEGIVNGKEDIGGVCGQNTNLSNNSTIENCYNTGAVSATCGPVGGVCGWNGQAIKNCHNTGTVTSTGEGENLYVGGVSGLNTNDGAIENCYNTGAVSATGATAYVGGVCGNFDSTNGQILNCYNTGAVSATGSMAWSGGVCGGNSKTNPQNCYYLENCATSAYRTNTEGTSKTLVQFTCGEVAWLLNGNKLKYDNDSEIPTGASSWKWYQKLDNDASPILKKDEENNTVYAAKKKCDTGEICGWANSITTPLALEHNFGEATISATADESTENLYSYIQTCTTSGCGATQVAAEKQNEKMIKGLNSSTDSDIEITKSDEDWTTDAAITLNDEYGTNYYDAPIAFTTTGEVKYSRTFTGTTKWATLCLPYALTISDYDGKCKFYELQNVESDKITLTELTGTINAGKPVFVKRDNNTADGTIEFNVNGAKMMQTPTGKIVTEGKLVGAFKGIELTNVNDLFIKNDQMWAVSQANKNMKVKPFRAYIEAGGSGAPQRSIMVDGEATAISDALDIMNSENSEYYDTNGRRINVLQKGVNIIKNGNRIKKVIIK